MNDQNILLCGVGGQGTVLASRLLADAAMKKGCPVMSAETIGMAQRGGSVTSHVRMGENLYAPMIGRGEADLLLGFEPGEAVRMLPYLKPDGYAVVSERAVKPVTATLSGSDYGSAPMLAYLQQQVKNLVVVDTETACRLLGSPKVLNMVLLGAAVRTGALDISMDEIKEALKENVRPEYYDLNIQALDYTDV